MCSFAVSLVMTVKISCHVFIVNGVTSPTHLSLQVEDVKEGSID